MPILGVVNWLGKVVLELLWRYNFATKVKEVSKGRQRKQFPENKSLSRRQPSYALNIPNMSGNINSVLIKQVRRN